MALTCNTSYKSIVTVNSKFATHRLRRINWSLDYYSYMRCPDISCGIIRIKTYNASFGTSLLLQNLDYAFFSDSSHSYPSCVYLVRNIAVTPDGSLIFNEHNLNLPYTSSPPVSQRVISGLLRLIGRFFSPIIFTALVHSVISSRTDSSRWCS